MYSLVNLAAAVLDRRGNGDAAREAAQVASALEQWAKAHVDVDELLDYRATGQSTSNNLRTLALTTNRMFAEFLAKVEGASATVSEEQGERNAELRENAAGTVLTYTVPVVQFTGDMPNGDSDVSLADALAMLSLPGAFDSLRDKVAASAARGDFVKAPAALSW